MLWALHSLLAGFRRAPLWLRLAFTDIQVQYKRSVLGLLWVALSFGAFILVKIMIFGTIASVDIGYFAMWVGVGFWLWTLISTCVVEGTRTFLSARSWILGTSLPLPVYVFQTAARTLMRFGFALPAIIVMMFIFNWAPTMIWLWVIPAFALILVNMIWVILLFGTLGARFNDVVHLLQTLMQVSFFLTPILYVPEMLGEKAYLLNYNPFTHYLAILRDPIVGNGVPIMSWQIVGALTALGWTFALFIYARTGRHVPFHIA